MNDIDRYLLRATRGLWGKRRAQAQQELRGATEDKIYRSTLAGHAQPQALRLALRDLGDPGKVAGDLRAVHVAPRQFQLGAALALAAALCFSSVNVAAQVAGASFGLVSSSCDYSSAGTQKLQQEYGPSELLGGTLRKYGQARLEAWCRRARSGNSEALDYNSLLQVLRDNGVGISDKKPENRGIEGEFAPGTKWLTFPGSIVAAWLTPPMPTPDGRAVIPKETFVSDILQSSGFPVTIKGEINPTLTVGTTSFRVGTKNAPVLATDLYNGAIGLQLDPWVQTRLPNGTINGPGTYADPAASAGFPFGGASIRIDSKLPSGSLVSGMMRTEDDEKRNPSEYDLFTTRVQSGGFDLPGSIPAAQLRFVRSLEELRTPFPPRVKRKVLMVRLTNTSTLHELGYEELDPAQLRAKR